MNPIFKKQINFFFQNNMTILKNSILIIICFFHFTARGYIFFNADSVNYYLAHLDQNKSHDNQLILNIISLLNNSSLNEEQLAKADSIIQNYRSKLKDEYYYSIRLELNVKLVDAKHHTKAFERILNDISFLKESNNEFLHYLLIQNFMELRVPVRNSNRIREGIKLYLQWINEYEKINDSVIVATLYHGLRGFYSTLGLIDKSFDINKKCIQFIPELLPYKEKPLFDFGPVLAGQQGILWQQWIMGSVYIYFNKFKNGSTALYAAKSIYEKGNLQEAIGAFPHPYLELLNYKSISHGDSIDYYREAALIELNKNKVNLFLYAHYFDIISHYFYLNSNFDSAETYIRKSIKLKDSLQMGVSTEYGNLQTGYQYAFIKVGQKKFKEAIPLLINEIEQLKDANLRTEILNEYDLLADVYKMIGDYKNTALILEKYKTLKNEIVSDEIKNRSLSFEIEQWILQEQKNSKALSQENKKNRNAKYFFLGFSILILITAIVLIKNARIKRKITIEKLRLRISRDLHDDIGSTLSSINIISNLAQKPNDQNNDFKAQEALKKINERSQRLLDNMSDIVWSVKPENDTLEEILSRMRLFATTVLEVKGINYIINFPINKINFKISLEIKISLYLIFKEAVNNLVKYSQCKNATLTLNIVDENICLKIQDDGIGFDHRELKHVGGLMNMQNRADEINAKFSIKSANEKGTLIILIVAIENEF